LQVAELLLELDGMSVTAAELMSLRPQAAKAEAYARRLREAGIQVDE
jgi:hypothetical protein